MPLLEMSSGGVIPRIFCYFDDVVGNDYEVHCQFAGELLAIREFNEEHAKRKLALINGLPRREDDSRRLDIPDVRTARLRSPTLRRLSLARWRPATVVVWPHAP